MLLDRFRDRHEQHAGLGQFRLERGRDRDRVEHRIDGDAAVAALACAAFRLVLVRLLADAEQRFTLAQRNPELLVSAQDFGIDLVERFRPVLLLRRGVIVDVLIIDRAVFDLGPFRLAHGEPALVGVEPPGQHPFRLVLLGRDEADDVLGKSFRCLLGLDLGFKPILVLIDVDTADLIDGLLHCRHSSLRSRFQGPRVGSSRYGRRPGSDHPHLNRLNRSKRSQIVQPPSPLGSHPVAFR